MSKKEIIYKNDLKFSDNFNLHNSEFESDSVKKLYERHKDKPKIEMRITDSEMENFEYLDLSSLKLNDELLEKLFNLEKIKKILSKIKYLDLSSNELTKYPNIKAYKNIIYLSLSRNLISGSIFDNNLIELTCDFNKISKIESSSITKLSANNNELKNINVPSVKVLHINNNKITEIDEYFNLEYLECIENEISSIKNLFRLQEIYVANNKLETIENMPNLLILNCVNNPIKKINFFENVKLILTSTPMISSRYKVGNITKMKNDYLINMHKNT
jgi:hypothetical protein